MKNIRKTSLNFGIMQLTIAGVILLFFDAKNCFAQQNPPDTLYYLFEPDKVPHNDRMITEAKGSPYTFYTIECECMSRYQKPVLRTNIFKGEKSTKAALGQIMLITLPKLISKLRSVSFSKDYVLYLILAEKDGFVKRKAYLEKNEPVLDSQ